eukprot:5426210-Pleurochrysis_carterae.AAC.3
MQPMVLRMASSRVQDIVVDSASEQTKPSKAEWSGRSKRATNPNVPRTMAGTGMSSTRVSRISARRASPWYGESACIMQAAIAAVRNTTMATRDTSSQLLDA